MQLRATDDRGAGLVGILTLLAALIGTSVVAGLIGAGLFMPAVGAAGATARSGVNFFDALPAEFERSPLAQQSRILDAEGRVIATFYNENRIIVPLAKIAPAMQKAQIAIEDSRFYEHGGIDPQGIGRALVANLKAGSSAQGASTLTQQFVKLTLQENAVYAGDTAGAEAAVEKKYARKLQELKYAITIEKNMTKAQILEGYLNIAYFGDGVYGVETAARHFFSTTAAKLTVPQAALLAGLVQLPSVFDPRKRPQRAIERRNLVLTRMLQTQAITQQVHDAAVKTKLSLKVSATGNGCDASSYPFFCDYIYRQVLTNKAFGATEQARRTLLFRGGLTVKTSLAPKIQEKAQKAIHDAVSPRNQSNVAAAFPVVEPGTGKVLAMAQSQPYGRNSKKGQTVLNYNVDKAYGASSGFQPGSTFKAFTLAAALVEGRSLNSTVNAPPGGTDFPASDFASSTCWPMGQIASRYAPFNSENRGESGTLTLRKITADSVNTGFVRLQAEVGVCKVKEVAESLGMHGAVTTLEGISDGSQPTDAIRPRATMTLGTQEVSPLTLTAAYAAFAADGVYCAPLSILSATTVDGKKIAVPGPSCKQVLDKNVARGVTSALEEVLRSGTAAGAPKVGRPAAGKTGTANESKATWFAGYTPQLAAAVWLGKVPDPAPMRRGVDTGKIRRSGQIYGGTIAAPIWASFMRAASVDLPTKSFGQPNDKIIYGDRQGVPGTAGMTLDEATRLLQEAGFPVQIGSPMMSSYPLGTVATSMPGGSARVPPGTTVTLYPSIGGGDIPGGGTTPTWPGGGGGGGGGGGR